MLVFGSLMAIFTSLIVGSMFLAGSSEAEMASGLLGWLVVPGVFCGCIFLGSILANVAQIHWENWQMCYLLSLCCYIYIYIFFPRLMLLFFNLNFLLRGLRVQLYIWASSDSAAMLFKWALRSVLSCWDLWTSHSWWALLVYADSSCPDFCQISTYSDR